jgi:alginate production protein
VRLGGWGFDTGVALRLPIAGEPAIAAGYASASGDTSRDDGVDTNFRQTGLNDNSGRFHGLKRFAYYGAVFDPELSNLEILTLGAGVKPVARVSVDFVYHRYRQRVLRRSLPSNALLDRATGRSPELGEEMDLVVSVQRFRNFDFSVVAGIFRPGEGLVLPVRPALYWKPELRVFF